LLLTCGVGCNRDDPRAAFDHALKAFQHGDLKESQDLSHRQYEKFEGSDPAWALRFRILEAESMLWRGMSQDALNLLRSVTVPAVDRESAIHALAVQGVAFARLHSFREADSVLGRAEELCLSREEPTCGTVTRARGILAVERGRLTEALGFFQQSRSFAASHADRFLEATALSNLGLVAVAQEHFDEAKDQSDAAYQAATALDAARVALVAQGNSGWASYRLGDSEKALEDFRQTEQRATQLGDIFDQENELTNIGYIYLDQRKYDLAAQSFQRALELASGIAAKQDEYNALRVLARLALQQDDLDGANHYAEQALAIAKGNHVDDLYPFLVQGQVAARRGDAIKARQVFESVEQDKLCPVFLKWEAQHSLALLDEANSQLDAADSGYRAALATFESARSTVRHEDFQLSFLTNAASIYGDYVHFLVARKKMEESLRWADYSRARTLSEGLGLLSKEPLHGGHAAPSVLSPRDISRQAQGTLLFYWLGEKQSYLWAITPSKTTLLPLPPGAEIDSMVQRYRQALNGPQDVLAAGEEGRALYRTLIAPAKDLLRKNAKVFIIPDGSLNNLNFETLVVPEPHPHYWIDDAVIVNVSSLRVLAASFTRENSHEKKHPNKLLLIGDSVAPSKEYPELPRAGDQMASVARHFPAIHEQVYRRGEATPSAYLASNPETFSHIHFVAHGTASRLSPLDSAIVLSKGAAETDSFKLYARDIVQHPLHADLVTISACYGAGSRAYSGEGLVGLAWAFLRAGAHNVIASLWEVTDASTEQLMDRFYDELDKGASPDAALRAAKLSLLHGSAFHNPFYWAPFQLYTGS
jgi:CHAT domain-containing protein